MEPGSDITVALRGETLRFGWCAASAAPPRRVAPVDDRASADAAVRRALGGEGLAWLGDWHNARQLLVAMGRRVRPARPSGPGVADAFRADRATRRLESAVLGRLLVPIEPGWVCPLRRAPALAAALTEAFGEGPRRPSLMPLRDILGAVGAYEWFRRGVPVPALGGNVHPRYGVFAPVRGEYVDLVAATLARRGDALRLREGAVAFDVGTGTGVLAILLARAGARVVATDVEPAAVRCARENAERFAVSGRIEALQADLFPPGRARLVVANPPWLPEEPHGPLDRAVYDPGGRMLSRLIRGVTEHLDERGEAWLVLSDLAERLALRPAGAVEALLRDAGLDLVHAASVRPSHSRARESRTEARRSRAAALLAAARAAETTRVFVLRPRDHSERGAS